MLLTCPNCETIFRVDSQSIGEDGRTVRCSVCSHVWFALPPKSVDKTGKARQSDANLWKMLRVPLALLVALGLLVAGAINQRLHVTAYLPGLIPAFDLAGLTIRPDINRLEVIDVQAEYGGDTLRLRGALKNNGGLRTHAASLLVTIAADDGRLLNEHVITPDDRLIEAGESTPFFAQLMVEQSEETTITVVPIGSRIFE